ncbi:hypothetical protein E1292_34120 [Nonomuraea deserti]|uniref:Uncharacterized protein n=1 Tax=Nonomuraea deserti TaxID=1848322 RepID=A0A4R4VA56_9ACTN|nr:hypothetical protein [Nonomuraea deserti]TDC98774.1 hypothetical protein E1292_34120 [Nonomuraea deserti]
MITMWMPGTVLSSSHSWAAQESPSESLHKGVRREGSRACGEAGAGTAMVWLRSFFELRPENEAEGDRLIASERDVAFDGAGAVGQGESGGDGVLVAA